MTFESDIIERTALQENTIDKKLLKNALLDESLFPLYDINYRNYLIKHFKLEGD